MKVECILFFCAALFLFYLLVRDRANYGLGLAAVALLA